MKKFAFIILPITFFLLFATVQPLFNPAVKAYAKSKKNTSFVSPQKGKKKHRYSSSFFSYKGSINPWNMTITLKSKRIMRKNEVQHSKLFFTKKGKKKGIFQARFSSLSSDGTTIKYTILKKDQKKLCPLDRSKNGKYLVKCSLFSKRKILSYHERIPSGTIAGFVVNDAGKPLSNTSIILQNKNTTKKVMTNSLGYYKFTTKSGLQTISVSKKDYQPQKRVLTNKLSKGTLCENFTLQKNSTSCKANNHSLEFEIKNTQNKALANASVYVTKKDSSDILFSGKTDQSGRLLFSNTNTFYKEDYSVIEHTDTTKISFQKEYQPKSNNRLFISNTLLDHDKEYTVFIRESVSTVQTPCSQTIQFSFRFADFMTDHLYFMLSPAACPALSLKQLALKTDAVTILPTDSLSCSFFTSDSHMPFYSNEWQLSAAFLGNPMSLSDTKKLYLPDGAYYIQLTLYDHTHTCKALSSVIPVNILNGKAYADTIILQKAQKAMGLNFAEYTLSPLQTSFDLYQKKNADYFYQNTIFSTPFSLSPSGYQHADLLLTPICQDEEYVLIAKKTLHLRILIIHLLL